MVFSIKSLMSNITEKIEPVKKYLTSQTVILEDIPLELTNEFTEDLSSEIPVTRLDDGSNKTDNISNNPSSFSIKVQITGDDKDRIYEKIISLVKKRQPVSLYVDKLYSNLGITSVSKNLTTYTYIEVTISFTQMEYAHIEFIPAPSIAAKPIVSDKTEIKTGKQEWEGELASESIKLRGE